MFRTLDRDTNSNDGRVTVSDFNFLTDPMTVKVKETIIETFPVVVSSKLRHGLYVSEGLQEGHDGP